MRIHLNINYILLSEKGTPENAELTWCCGCWRGSWRGSQHWGSTRGIPRLPLGPYASTRALHMRYLSSNVAGPDPSDLYDFGPPGSGSGSFTHQAKIVRRTLIPTVLWLLFDFLSFKNDENVLSKSNKQKTLFLKGQCHEIFCFLFFSWISFPQAPDHTIRAVSNFFESSRRYSQLKVCHLEKIFNPKFFFMISFGHLLVV